MQPASHLTFSSFAFWMALCEALRNSKRSNPPQPSTGAQIHWDGGLSGTGLVGSTEAVQKGRASDYGLLRLIQRLAAHTLASGVKIQLRWIPSERNAADAGSRAWEPWSSKEHAPRAKVAYREGHLSSKEEDRGFHQDGVGEGQRSYGCTRPELGDHGDYRAEEAKEVAFSSEGGSGKRAGAAWDRCLLKATQKKREKARARQRKFAKKLRASLGGHGLLEMASVKEATRKDYLNKLRGFYDFVSFHALSIQDEAGLDAALCDYGDVLYLDGESCNFGQKLLASLEFVRPEAARAGKLQLPRFKKSLKGWRRLAPTQTRLPMPEFLKSSISGILIHFGKREMALFNEVGFSTYARPGELLRMKAVDFVGYNRDFQYSVLVVAPFERGEESKAGVYDETLILDNVRAPWLESTLHSHVQQRLKQGEDADLWSFSAAQYLSSWREAVNLLQIGDVASSPYQNRHGGASRDHLMKLRSVQAIQRRGRWAVDSSARVYDKPGRLQQVINKYSDLLQEFGEQVRTRFPVLYQSGSCRLPKSVTRALAKQRGKAS